MTLGVYNAVWALVLLPLFGAAVSFLAETPRRAAQACTVASVLALLVAAIVLGARLTHPLLPPFEGLLSFFLMNPPEGTVFATQFQPQLGVLVDSLSASFGFAVAFVVALVQTYALTTLRGDEGYRRFFWTSSLLSFATLAFVFSPNLFDSAFMWIIGSAAIYLLAAHWWDRQDAAAPARRAYVALHVGDVALLLGLVVVFVKLGLYGESAPAPAGQTFADPFGFDQAARIVGGLQHGLVGGAGLRTLAVIASILVFAAVVRAAQLPFHVWLTEVATAPVPALAMSAGAGGIAGVYLLARVYPFLLPVPALTALALTGALTALFAAVVALAQRDILRIAVLAMVAELGLAIAALGTGGYGQGLFILFTALLFCTLVALAAGNLVRVYRTRNIHEMGGAWRRMRWTSIALIAWAAGVSGLSLNTYYALASVFANTQPSGDAVGAVTRAVVALLVVLAAALLALAAFRTVWHVCAGEVVRRRGFQPERVAEAEPPLRRALRIATLAAALSVIVGLPGIGPVHAGSLSIPGLTFTRFVWLNARPSLPVDGLALLLGIAAAAAGAAGAWLAFAPERRAAVAARTARAEPVVRLVARGFNLERYAHRLGRPFVRAGGFVSGFDDTVTETLGDTVAQGSLLASTLIARARTARTQLYLAGGLALAAVLALLSILAATGHFWIHSV